MDHCLTVLWVISLCIRTVVGQCGDIPAIGNSENNLNGSPPYPEGTTVDFSCSNLYTPQGNPRYTCTGREWIGGSFSCRAAECSALEEPLHGQMIGDHYEVGSVMRFQCDTGYNLVGESALICGSDLEWEPPNVPQCQIKTCPAVPSVQHGTVDEEQTVDGQNNVYGAVFVVRCDQDYMISGPARIHCDENGAWTEKPKCELVTCPPYPDLDAKCVLKSKLQASNTLLLLYCTDNATFVYSPEGDGTAFCDGGRWDDPNMRCYCDCKITADTHYVQLTNLDAKGFLKHNVTLLWSCKHGATKASLVPLTCDDGSVGTPKCTPAPTPSPATPETTKPKNTTMKGTTDKNVTDSDGEGSSAVTVIVAVLGGIFAAAIGVAVICIYIKKYKKGHNSDSNAKSSDVKEKSSEMNKLNTNNVPEKDANNEHSPMV